MKKLGYLLLGVFIASLLLTVPLFAADKQEKVSRQPRQSIQQWLTNLEKLLDSLNLTAEQKDLALKIEKERAEAFIKFATAQAQLRRLARYIKNGQQVSDEEVKKALETYYKEQNKYLATLKKTEKELGTLPPKAQVVILAPGLVGGRAVSGRMGGGWQRQMWLGGPNAGRWQRQAWLRRPSAGAWWGQAWSRRPGAWWRQAWPRRPGVWWR
ncbi:hypothetical protein H5T88_08385 [bacterium]|nr:hypothetical protein [bacterium]